MRYFVQNVAGSWVETDEWCFLHRCNINGGPDVRITVANGQNQIVGQYDLGNPCLYVVVTVARHGMMFAAEVGRRMLLAPWSADQIVGRLFSDKALRAVA